MTMVDGGDQARAFNSGSYGAKTAPQSGQYVEGRKTLGSSGEVKGATGAGPTLAGVVELAAIARKFGMERCITIEDLASRAISIATRIAGSYPCGAPPGDSRVDGERVEPHSALDALVREVVAVREPLSRMDQPLNDLSAALDVLERSIG
ncbi:hypothetical protein ACFZ8E_24985 [Methylobacterium sp. HMF5984]|uniref:hypothetical protein n=1 Tax=Methylobacterium sp. HMF5984 TaxID=3367370 RepID=UPI003852A357